MPSQLVTYKFKLKPTKGQSDTMENWLGVCRLIYNLGLSVWKEHYKMTGKSIHKYDLYKQVSDLNSDFDWVKTVHSHVKRDAIDKLCRSYQNFFRGAGFPKFAKKGTYTSFTYTQGVTVSQGSINLPKIGDVHFFNDGRSITGKQIKTAIIKKELTGWFISLLVEEEIEYLPRAFKSIGLDLGVSVFLYTSDGVAINNPRFLKRYEESLRRAQRKISRRRKGSKRRDKAIKEAASIYRKIKNSRMDFLHKISSSIINKNQVIVVEDLKLNNLTKSNKGTLLIPGVNVSQKRGLNRAILDLAGGNLFKMLEYKSKWRGRSFYRVDPKYTSQTCSVCGNVDRKNRVSQSLFLCTKCDNRMNADHNAAINILGRACPSGEISGVNREPEIAVF